MGRDENVIIFRNTEKMCNENSRLKESIRKARDGQKLILAGEPLPSFDRSRWFSVWQGIVMEISERIRTVLPKMPGRSGDELLMGIAQILYLRYKLEQPLIPQVKENAILVGKMITMVEGTLANATGRM